MCVDLLLEVITIPPSVGIVGQHEGPSKVAARLSLVDWLLVVLLGAVIASVSSSIVAASQMLTPVTFAGTTCSSFVRELLLSNRRSSTFTMVWVNSTLQLGQCSLSESNSPFVSPILHTLCGTRQPQLANQQRFLASVCCSNAHRLTETKSRESREVSLSFSQFCENRRDQHGRRTVVRGMPLVAIVSLLSLPQLDSKLRSPSDQAPESAAASEGTTKRQVVDQQPSAQLTCVGRARCQHTVELPD